MRPRLLGGAGLTLGPNVRGLRTLQVGSLGVGGAPGSFGATAYINGTAAFTSMAFQASTGTLFLLNGGRIEFRHQNGAGITGSKFTLDGASPFCDITNAGTTIVSQSAANNPLVLRGAASQSGDLLQLQNSSSTVLSSVDAAGRILVPAGALATCGLGIQSDPNTGLYSSGADALSLVAGGVDRLQVNSTGIGFFATAPVAQQAHVGDPSGGATQDAEARTAINSILDILQVYGLMAA